MNNSEMKSSATSYCSSSISKSVICIDAILKDTTTQFRNSLKCDVTLHLELKILKE